MQEQTKDEMLKSGWFLDIYSVFVLERSMHCVYIGPEGTNIFFLPKFLNSQYEEKEKVLKEQLSHLSTLLPTLQVFLKDTLAKKI